MKKIILIAVLNLVLLNMYAQDTAKAKKSNRYVDYGLIRVQGNVALGKPLSFSGTNIYWVGDMDIYCRDNVSISTGFYYFFGSFGGDQRFSQNHMAYLGASYHFKTNNHLDPYIGILPGYTVSQLNRSSSYFNDSTRDLSSYPWSFNPVIAVQAGMVYYANRFFNVFVNVKYQTGKHFSDIAPQPLDELKISFGLGYMLWARKHWVRFRKPNDTSQ